jgi:hypothetical protein
LFLVVVFFNYTPYGIAIATTSQAACLATQWGLFLSSITSVVNVLGLTLERLVALSVPFRNLSPRKGSIVVGGIILSWVVGCADASILLLGASNWRPGQRCNIAVFKQSFLVLCAFLPISVSLLATAIANSNVHH